VKDGTIIVDDANSTELARLLKKYRPNLLISGAKEKYISLKLGFLFVTLITTEYPHLLDLKASKALLRKLTHQFQARYLS